MFNNKNPDINKLEPKAPKVQSQKKSSVAKSLFDYVEIFTICICAVFIIYSFFIRICNVSGTSMNNTLQNGEALVVSDLFYEPKPGDIITFHQTGQLNEPVVKRVIAVEGQTVKIDFLKGIVYIDGKPIEEDYAYISGGSYDPRGYARYDFDPLTKIFETTVGEGELFVMGDNRNNSLDSRSTVIGMVDKRRVLGHVILRLSPFGKVD